MFSISPAELMTIAVIALIVLGPRRLIEVSRWAGRLAAQIRRATEDLRTELKGEIDDIMEPIEAAKSEFAAASERIIEDGEGEPAETPQAGEEPAAEEDEE